MKWSHYAAIWWLAVVFLLHLWFAVGASLPRVEVPDIHLAPIQVTLTGERTDSHAQLIVELK